MSQPMTDKGQRTCSRCGFRCESWCPVCVAAFPSRRPVAEMSAEERAEELLAWDGPMEIPFSMLHQRIEELVGRGVWTHELAGSAAVERLAAEIRRGVPANFAEVVDKVPAEKLITVGLEGNGVGST